MGTTEQQESFRDLKLDDVKRLIDEGYDVVDVREDSLAVLSFPSPSPRPLHSQDLRTPRKRPPSALSMTAMRTGCAPGRCRCRAPRARPPCRSSSPLPGEGLSAARSTAKPKPARSRSPGRGSGCPRSLRP